VSVWQSIEVGLCLISVVLGSQRRVLEEVAGDVTQRFSIGALISGLLGDCLEALRVVVLTEEGLVSLEVCKEALLFEVNGVVIQERDWTDQLPAPLWLRLRGLIELGRLAVLD